MGGIALAISAGSQAGPGIGFAVLGASAAACWFVGWLVFPPFTVRRRIEMDFGRDEFRVYRNGSRKLTRKLSRLANLTLEAHPGAELEYRQRQGKLGPKQKQQCLFGWFGARGAEKVMLLPRWEWPAQDSLVEVLKAIEWVFEHVGNAQSAPFKQAETELAGAVPDATRSIKPPLD